MATQTALWLPKVGSEFELGKNEIPEPGPGEVLVALEATAINPVDCMIQKEGFFLVQEYPAIIGENGSGIVQKVGSDVTNLVVGDRITFQSAYGVKYGTFQQYCLAFADLATQIPPNISSDEAAPISVCFNPFAVATYAQQPQGLGFTAPFETGGFDKYAGQPIMIIGGATSLGQYAIQLAKLSGFDPIITTASLKNRALLHTLGATHVLDRELGAAALKEGIRHITSVPLTYIFDAVSVKETQETGYDLLAPGGTLAIVNFMEAEEDGTGHKTVLMVYGSFHIPENRALGAKFAKALTTWLAEERIKPNPVQVLPGGLYGIVDGMKKLGTSGVSAKKLIVHPFETRA